MNKITIQILASIAFGIIQVRVASGTKECRRPVLFSINPDQLNASTSLNDFPAKDGLINEYDFGSWCAAVEDQEQWLEVDLQEKRFVMAIGLQGRYGHSWVEMFYVQYSTDGNKWYCYGSEIGHKIFQGNENSETVKIFVLHLDSIFASYIRINPRTWNNSICLRTEIYGCPYNPDKDYDTRRPMYQACGLDHPTSPPTTTPPPPTTSVEQIIGGK
ncbi:inactive carboxypeptidase-like protein X2 [Stylophora pistillata]|uniref:inactive carboxypeptidase-like protein X2 n=1 Tax=Stylophora pistillata TaxID=50429 RepID=UPI000C03FCD2|nr:inactive carboxypeptidase-like protein X2 [Stylophora pistillata]